MSVLSQVIKIGNLVLAFVNGMLLARGRIAISIIIGVILIFNVVQISMMESLEKSHK